MRPRIGLLVCVFASVGVLFGPGRLGADGSQPTGHDRITVRMEPCQLTRQGTGILLRPADKNLVRRGTVEIEGKRYTLYLPEAKAYSVRNTAKRDNGFQNTCARLAIDQKGDGKLTELDNWFANLPVRLGDRMFDVAEIAADGSRIVLRPSKAPLQGVIVGRRCPPFSFQTADGKTISRDRFAGKPFLLDIWSIT
jgi:hypothetical protein